MSYNKLGFTKGQTLKAEHLNHMEDGIANAPKTLTVKLTVDNYAFMNYRKCYIDSYDDIYETLISGGVVWIDNSDFVVDLGIASKFCLITCWDLTPEGLELSYSNSATSLLCPNGSYTPEWEEE